MTVETNQKLWSPAVSLQFSVAALPSPSGTASSRVFDQPNHMLDYVLQRCRLRTGLEFVLRACCEGDVGVVSWRQLVKVWGDGSSGEKRKRESLGINSRISWMILLLSESSFRRISGKESTSEKFCTGRLGSENCQVNEHGCWALKQPVGNIANKHSPWFICGTDVKCVCVSLADRVSPDRPRTNTHTHFLLSTSPGPPAVTEWTPAPQIWKHGLWVCPNVVSVCVVRRRRRRMTCYTMSWNSYCYITPITLTGALVCRSLVACG